MLIKAVSETIKNESKEQKGWFLIMLLSTLGATLLGNLLTDKNTSKGTTRTAEDTVRAVQVLQCHLVL